jgi:hypothetical protein
VLIYSAPVPKLSKSNLLVPDLSPLDVQRLIDLRRQIRIAQTEIKSITGRVELVERKQVECMRCGKEWYPNNPYLPPVTCPRCGSTAWSQPPTEQSRKPSDPPAKSWRYPKGERKPKIRIRVPKAPWEIVTSVEIPPPPPLPMGMTPPPPPMFTRFDSEPQPEVQSSHEPPTIEDTMQVTLDAARDDIQQNGLLPVIEEIILDVSPEQVGQPATDAEREELEKARSTVWPTTSSE